MQVTEISNSGLSLELEVLIEGKALAEKVNNTVIELAKTYKMPGFRDGNVPLSFIKKKEGSRIMTEAIEKEIDSVLQEIFQERGIRPASQPSVDVISFDEKEGLLFRAKLEIFPQLPDVDWSAIKLDTVKIKISNQDFNNAYKDILSNLKNYEEMPSGSAADTGDAVMIDFVGSVDGSEFEGGSGNGVRLELGSKQFIEGFETQLIGVKAGEERVVNVTFPQGYHKKELSSKNASFKVTVKSVLQAKLFEEINDDVAKQLGLESLEKLNEAIKQKMEIDFQGVVRLRTKKLLFDKIDEHNRFDVPQSMLKLDFESMWEDIMRQKKEKPEDFAGKSDDQLHEEYKKISERRVRLGLILAETAKKEKIEVSDEELQYAVTIQAMQNPSGSGWIRDHYKKPENLERLREPLLEEKVVDFILTKIQLNEIEVSSKEFFEKYADDINSIK